MSDIKFACPHCQQHIQAEPGYAGLQITCPACHGSMVVPGQAAAPQPVAALSAASSEVPAYVPSPPGAAPAPAPAAAGCPSCGAALPRGTVLCTKCGYNLATGQRMKVGRGAGAAAVRKAASGSTSWASNPNVWLISLLVLFGGLYLFGRSNQPCAVGFVLVGALYAVVIHITVVVMAFREGAGHGLGVLCFWPYAIYFVFARSESPMLKALYTVSLLVELGIGSLKNALE